MAERRYRGSAAHFSLLALAFGGTAVLAASLGISTCKDAAVLVFFGTKAAFFALFACQYVGTPVRPWPITFFVGSAGYLATGVLILISVLLHEVAFTWILATILAFGFGVTYWVAARKMRSSDAAKVA